MTEGKIQSAVRYPSDLTDEEGEILEPIINELESYTIGRLRKRDLRELLNAIFYRSVAIVRATRNGVGPISDAQN